jgi:hypothetical protein
MNDGVSAGCCRLETQVESWKGRVMTTDSWAGLVALLFMLVLAATSCAWHFRQSRGLLERWADRNGYRIIDARYQHVFRGPFVWTTSKGQTVYRVTLDVKGEVSTGWVRCGSWWLGLMSEKVEVRWDEGPAKTSNLMHDQWVDG